MIVLVAMVTGAEIEGFPGVAHGLFPRGGIELVNHFYVSSNQSLVEGLKEEIDTRQAAGDRSVVLYVTIFKDERKNMVTHFNIYIYTCVHY